ncbi:MAG: DoxX family protein [Alphaproteobacteria bacterium]|nr:DoxX family protein [Alphaproteobacteria bacterium]
MDRFLGKHSELFYAALRVVAGFLFACHGAQKLFGILGAQAELSDPEGLAAGIIEFFGGSMIALGLLSSYAAFIASGEMAVAYFKAHAPRGLFPIMNGGELAALFSWLFLFIAARGAGRYSLDALRVRPDRVRTITAQNSNWDTTQNHSR